MVYIFAKTKKTDMKKILLPFILLLIHVVGFSQVPVAMDTVITPSGDTLIVPKEDTYIDTTTYNTSGDDNNNNDRSYCNNSVSGLSPTKILSLGFDYVAPYSFNSDLDFDGGDTSSYKRNTAYNGGLRFSGNIPIVSRTQWLLNFGFNYWRSGYKFKDTPSAFDLYGNRLQSRGLNNLGLSLTLFKPLNEKHFIIVMAQGEVSGDYSFKEMFNRFQYTKGSYTALFGWKKKETKLFAVGLSRTWRGGEPLPIPVILWNQTFNSRWGIELLLPARGAVRYNFSPRSLLLLGYELEGTSYNMQFNYMDNPMGFVTPPPFNKKFEMRRSEIRARLTWEKQLLGFIWLSVQAGVRVNYRNAVAFDNNQDRGNFVISNKVATSPYGIISINLVTP